MRFRTEYESHHSPGILTDYAKTVLFLGSCFADAIGSRMLNSGWQAVVNPCGVLYNPASIYRTLRNALSSSYLPSLSVHPVSGMYFSYDFSTKFSHKDSDKALATMTESVRILRNALQQARALFITFGTSWVFDLADGGYPVANCHKLPARMFRRRCMSIAEMETLWQPLISDLHNYNPELQIVFTVSPVRHLADGFEGNSRSKARLVLLCETLSELPYCHYFPAYEILNDDLRDYRFYANDLTHPSDFAADYIFSKFTQTYIPQSILPLMETALREHRRAAHRPVNPQ